MKRFSASTNIKASKDTIWKLLTDAPNYPTWDPGVIRIEGTIAPGQKITAYSKLNPNRPFPAKVTEFVPGERMVWSGGMPLGLFKGVRTFFADAARRRQHRLYAERGIQRAAAAHDRRLDSRYDAEFSGLRGGPQSTRRAGVSNERDESRRCGQPPVFDSPM
jgi:hypothetical protein